MTGLARWSADVQCGRLHGHGERVGVADLFAIDFERVGFGEGHF